MNSDGPLAEAIRPMLKGGPMRHRMEPRAVAGWDR
jgi:hypothetical protein